MAACVQEQNGISSNLSGGEKPQRVKGWFFFFFLLLLGGLGQAAGQGDPEHCHIHNIATVTDCTPHTQRCYLQNFPNEVMKKSTEENDTIVMRQQEKDSSDRTDQHVRRGLTQTERAVDPIVFDSPTDRCELAACNDACSDLYAKGKQGRETNPTETDFAKLLPKVLMAQSTPYTLMGKTSDSQTKWMEETLCAGPYREEVTERKDNFGHFQSFYNDVYKVKNLLKLGESVCKVTVEGVGHGTGFVLFDNFILTNAHLLKGHVDEKTMQLDVNVWAVFNYDDPQSLTNVYYFSCKKTLIDLNKGGDYAILELNPEGLNFVNKTKKVEVPPGLLKNFDLTPQSGQAFIIGHPGGGVKKMDATYLIEKKNRVQAINDHLRPYKDDLFTAYSIIQKITKQGIEHILPDGGLEEHVVTYKTFMRAGSSGSPVFDSSGRVFGLHSYLFHYNSGDNIIMGCANPLLAIYNQFVTKLKASGNYKLLRRVEEEARGNIWLELIAPPTNYHDDHKFSDDYTSEEEW